MSTDGPRHEDAVDAFTNRLETAAPHGVDKVIVFGSVARGTHGTDSDIDVLAVIDDSAAVLEVEEELRDIAFDLMLEFGTVFSIHAVTESTLDDRSGHPFFQNVLPDGQSIYG